MSLDVEVNPGPANKSSTIFPCGSCEEPVTWSDKGLMCDACDTWFNANCENVNSSLYDVLAVPGSALNVASQTTQMLALKAYNPLNQKIDSNPSMKVENLTRLLQ